MHASDSFRATVIVPAHNEATVIERSLRSLLHQEGAARVEVVVVANGCTDDTVGVAHGATADSAGVRVLDLAEPGKIGALNAGDAVATHAARIYLDADIELGPTALSGMLAALDTEGPVVCSPRARFDDSTSTWPVRAYYRIFSRMPYAAGKLIGLGVYGVSGAGRSRFGPFPDVTADDLFVQRAFSYEERTITPGEFVIRAPRDLANLLAVRTRAVRGMRELDTSGLAAHDLDDNRPSGMRAIAGVIARKPNLAVAAVVYVLVTMVARRRAATSTERWLRDESTRVSPGAHHVGDPPPVVIDGVEFTSGDEGQIVAQVMTGLQQGTGGLVVTPNVDILRQLRHPQHRDIRAAATLTVADGMPVVWASRIQRTPLPARVTGADLVHSLSRAAAVEGRSVYLFGAASGVAERAGERLVQDNPGLEIAGCSSPPRGFAESAEQLDVALSAVVDASPDIVFVAFGFPRQEQLAMALRDRLPATWFLGCGGSLDMAAGDVARATPALQALGAEWMHRLAKEPRRLARRYLVDDLPYVAGLFGRALRRRYRPTRTRQDGRARV